MPAAPVHVASLYGEHHRWLKAWLLRRLNNHCDAEDVAHDTFLRVLVSRRDYSGHEPRALLVRIAKGLVIDHWRHEEIQRAYLNALAHMPAALTPSPEERLGIIQALMQVDALLAAMPQRTRQVFLLAQLDGLTLQQIAAQTGIAAITVRRHIHKALLICMQVLDGHVR
ncbi:sigma-70 family RNA polymerase sigma factor [Corticibacter populi]|uniref:Sigma-70 family RNA polymerase sigma factor n=1 Tax=Corticibacter populi TaxID=1550736 RepID=A0A3M6R0F9_9BURK|nr:sigma-70 family RNA polymerase sigma factor [Corticibacter populi]RMX08746.1 sigma-70 family RNA polymerase sigma factor [Corticibacter populi]RZS36099.1 RNA polymerase sigma-70 factor (ECF subfamily) [Corticibacter populi]